MFSHVTLFIRMSLEVRVLVMALFMNSKFRFRLFYLVVNWSGIYEARVLRKGHAEKIVSFARDAISYADSFLTNLKSASDPITRLPKSLC